MAKITKVSILRNGTRKPVVPMEDINRTAGIVQYDSTNDLLKVDNDLTIDSLEVTGNAEIDGKLEVHKNIKADEDILTHGDLEVKGAAEFRNDVAITGDLYVDGQEHINDSETVQTTGDYFILRHNNNVPLGHGEKSGIAVFNYKTNRTATATVDEDGTWRIADNTATSTIHTNVYYFDGHYYDTSFVEQVFVDQIKTAFDEDEIANCVFYNSNSFYHFDGTSWFAVTLEDNHLITDETEVTDPTLIAALELLDKSDLQYFRRLQITQISEVENEPVLTRAEETDLQNNDILVWDATTKKAVRAPRPQMNNTYLKATLSGGAVSYNWSSGGGVGIAFIGTRAAYNAARLIPEGQDGFIPTGSKVIITDEDAYITGDER